MSDRLAVTLTGIVGADHVLTDPQVTRRYETDWTGRFGGRARCVVRPADTGEVSQVVAACAAAAAPVVPQGGNTGLVGGGVPRGGEVVVSLARLHTVAPVDTDAAMVTVGAGATLAAVHAAAAAAGLAYGVDFAARDSATVGGTIATNAGGVRVLRHGATRAQVLGVEAVLADGRVLRRPGAVPKDATGYDLPGLLTGSEGTLAVVTGAWLRLVPRDPARVVALLALRSTADAVAVLARLRAATRRLSAAEWFTGDGLDLVLAATGLAPPFPRSWPTYLLVECAGPTDPSAELAAALDGVDAVADVAVATDRPGRAALWAYRERHTEAIATTATATAGVAHKLDVAVPLRALPAFEAQAHQRCDEAGARLVVFGHLAEGNVHVNVVGPAADDDRLDAALLRLVADLGGSISAEHGIGVAKTAWLHLTRDATDRWAMAAVKRALEVLPDRALLP